MKHLLIALFCSFALSVFAQNEGIKFVTDDWETVLETAQKENKIIFVDAYTTWCGPCKWMAANVFPLEDVGEFYNKNFINVKMDMEKGDGLAVAKKYNVKAYPTYLFINGEGELMHKGMGSGPAETFIDIGEAAVDPDRQYGSLKKRYEKGERDSDFLKNYATAARSVRDDNYTDVAQTYLEGQKDWNTEENMEFIMEFLPADKDAKTFHYLLKNKEAFYETFSEKDVDEKIKIVVQGYLRAEKDVTPQRVNLEYQGIFDQEKATRYGSEFAMMHYMYSRKEEDKARFPEAATYYLSNNLEHVDNWNLLNSVAWTFYETVDSKVLLEKAATWAKRSVELESNYFNNDTVAALLYKVGEKEGAKKHALKAIELAEAAGDEPTETKELLKKIEAME